MWKCLCYTKLSTGFNAIPRKHSMAVFTQIGKKKSKMHIRLHTHKNNSTNILLNFEKEEQSWKYDTFWFQNLIKSQCYWHKNRHVDQWNNISSVQFSCVRLFVTPWITARQASLSITNSQSSLRLMFIKSVMPSSHPILCCPFLLLPPIPPSIRGFSNESTLCMRWPKYWSFSFSIIPSKVIPGLISFRMDWLALLPVQWTLKSLLQHHSSKTSIFRCLAFFTVQLLHPYMTTGKTIALTRWPLLAK